MTAGVLIVNEKGETKSLEKHVEKLKTGAKRRRRMCLMNTIAIGVVTVLVVFIVLKFVLTIKFEGWAWCGTSRVKPTFTIEGNTFMKDGKPFQYISGSIHYNRVPNVYWRDRLRKMKEAGLDAIQMYVPWNFHQPLPDQPPNWSGDRDIVKFVKTAQEEGLLVILRAGPYICGEWDFGGLPAWLLQKNASMAIRSSDRVYMTYATMWMTEMLSKMRPLLYQNGGPIIMVQLENEYGSYVTCDKGYVSALYDLGRGVLGDDIILFTTDGNSAGSLKCGALDRRFFATVDFGTGTANNPESAFAALRAIQPTGPLVNSEYYVGWLDIWGSKHAHVAVGPILQGLSTMYRYGASVNMYMFFGGTNFAYWNGAEDPAYTPQVTSYDYDAPLSEAGDMTWKYSQLKALIHQLKGIPLQNSTTTNSTKVAYGSVKMTPMCHFVSLLPKYSPNNVNGKPLTSMEAQGVYQGYAVYSTAILLTAGIHRLALPIVRDRAYVFTSDIEYSTVKYFGSVSRDAKNPTLILAAMTTGVYFLHILVENEGHVNYGAHMFGDTKGLFGNVILNGQPLTRWQFHPLDITANPYLLEGCDADGKPTQGMFYGAAGTLEFLKGPNDTFLLPTSFKKGQLLMNKGPDGHWMNAGRYWISRGPQRTLFVPSTFVRKGVNSIALFEVEGVDDACPGSCQVEFTDTPQLGEQLTVSPRGRRRN